MALPSAGRGHVAPRRRIDLGRLSSSTLTALVAAAFLPMAFGHDHEEGNIPDGETVSADPIV